MVAEAILRHRRSLLFLVVALVIAGGASLLQLPVALFPQVAFPRIAITVDAGDRPADQMEIQVTRRIEQALRSIPGLADIRSTSSRGSADVSVNFAWGTDMVAALLQAEAALSQLEPSLPPGTKFLVRRMDPTVFPVMALSLVSDSLDGIALRDLAEYQLAPVLSAVAGVARVDVQGGAIEEFRVSVDPDRLRAHGLAIADVAKALAAANVLTAVGRIEDRYHLLLVLSDTRFASADQIGRTILKSGDDGLVELQDIATVGRAQAPQWQRVVADGKPAVLMPIYQQPAGNTVQIGRDLAAKLAAFRDRLPAGVTIQSWYDQGALVSQSAASVRDAILIGAGLAALVLLLFLRSLRLTAIAVIVLPAVLGMTGLLLYAFGMSLNIMTLGGAAAAVGLIIDDTIVMAEHIIRRLRAAPAESGQVLAAAGEFTRPLAASSASTVIVFLPLAFLTGVTGGFFKALSITMAGALAISFLMAWLIVPLLADRLLGATAAKGDENGRLMLRLRRAHAGALGAALRRPWLILVLIVPLAALGSFAFTQVGSGFMPAMDEGGFVLDYRAPPGTSLSETDRLLRQIGAILRDTPDVLTWSRRTGLGLGGDLNEANQGDFFVRLKPGPRRDIAAVMEEVRRRIAGSVPGIQVEMSQLMEDLIGDLTAVPQPIEVKLFGDDAPQLLALAPRVADAIGKVPGVVDVRNGIVVAGDALDIEVDRTKAAIEGMTPDEVTAELADLLSGAVPSAVQQGVKMVAIRVWVPPDARRTVDQVGALLLRAQDGHVLPLRRIAAITTVTGQPQITRENLKRMVAVTARIEGRSIGAAAADVQQVLARDGLIPTSIYVELGGLYQQQQIAMHDLTIVFVAAVALVFALLLFLYESFAVAVAIVAMPLLAVGAVFIGLWLTGTERNITAMMGLTMVIGIVAEIAIFYFSEVELLRRTGQSARLLIEAGTNRLRPIAMTTIAAILALLPLSLALGQGSAMLKPLAIAIISGLIVQMPLVLWVMPVLYALLSRGLPENPEPFSP
jgi:CzcA family heavy metal efflux pump